MVNAITTGNRIERGRFGLAKLAPLSSVVMMLPAGCRQLRASSPRSPELQPTRPRLQRTKVGLGKLPRPTGWQPVLPRLPTSDLRLLTFDFRPPTITLCTSQQFASRVRLPRDLMDVALARLPRSFVRVSAERAIDTLAHLHVCSVQPSPDQARCRRRNGRGHESSPAEHSG